MRPTSGGQRIEQLQSGYALEVSGVVRRQAQTMAECGGCDDRITQPHFACLAKLYRPVDYFSVEIVDSEIGEDRVERLPLLGSQIFATVDT